MFLYTIITMYPYTIIAILIHITNTIRSTTPYITLSSIFIFIYLLITCTLYYSTYHTYSVLVLSPILIHHTLTLSLLIDLLSITPYHTTLFSLSILLYSTLIIRHTSILYHHNSPLTCLSYTTITILLHIYPVLP